MFQAATSGHGLEDDVGSNILDDGSGVRRPSPRSQAKRDRDLPPVDKEKVAQIRNLENQVEHNTCAYGMSVVLIYL